MVSVIIPTYNSRELLAVALKALEGQTITPEQLEILVVDDGSTDGTWPFLASQSRLPNLRAFWQVHTGSASAGRNVGIRHARGKYLFFHDADDYLGEDSLRRLVSAAEQEGSGVVVGRSSYVGSPPPHNLVAEIVSDADVLADGIWRSLSPHKLISRSLIDRLQLRFHEDMKQGEDQVFVASCLFAAERITKVRDYVHYYRRRRDDGLNLSRQPQTLQNKWLTTSRMTALVVANTVSGERREKLLRRVMITTLALGLSKPFMLADPTERTVFLTDLKREVLPHLTVGHLESASEKSRIRLAVAQRGDADDLVRANAQLARPARYRTEGGLVARDLGKELNRLLPPELRTVSSDEGRSAER